MRHRLACLFVLITALPLHVLADDPAVLNQLQREAHEKTQQANIGLAQLKAELLKTDDSPVSRSQLEQLTIDRDTTKYQQTTLANRLAKRRSQLDQMAADAPAAERAALGSLIATLDIRAGQLSERIGMLNQLLEAYGQRFQLDVQTMSNADESALERLNSRLKTEIATAQDLRNQTQQFTGTGDFNIAQRRLLDILAFISDERADLIQMELENIPLRAQYERLDELVVSDVLPVRALRDGQKTLLSARNQLALADQRLKNSREGVTRMNDAVVRRGRIIDGARSTYTEQIEALERFTAELEKSEKSLEKLLARTSEMSVALDQRLTSALRRELTTRKPWPQASDDWAAVYADFIRLPERVIVVYTEAARRFLENIERKGSQLAWLSGFFILACALGARYYLLRKFSVQPLGETLQACLTLIAGNAISLALPAWVSLLGWRYSFNATEWIVWLTPLLIWPIVRLGLGLTSLMLFRTPENRSDRQRIQLHSEIRWIFWLLPVPAAVFVMLQVIQVNPVLADLLDRVSMLALLLIAIPLVHLRDVMNRALVSRFGSPFWVRIVGGVATFIPVSLLISVLAGLAGYTSLAYTVGRVLGEAGLVLLAALLIQHVMRDGHERLAIRLRMRKNGAFKARYILHPLYQVASLGLIYQAFMILGSLYGWNAETPVMKGAFTLWNASLFSLADTPIMLSSIVGTAVLIFVVFWFGRWSREVILHGLTERLPDLGVRNSLATFTQYFIVIIGLLAAVRGLGLELTSLTVFAGALGVGLGFGLQNIANNFVSGILLLAERPLRNKDLVRIDNFEGEVVQIGIRSLTVRTFDNEDVVIPNSEVISKPFTNWTRGDDVVRFILFFGVSYKSDPHAVLKGIEGVLAANKAVLETPPPAVFLWEFADSAITFRVQYYIHTFGPVHRNVVRSQVLMGIWDMCRENGFEIPFPQRDVHLYRHDENAALPDMQNHPTP